MESGIQSSFIPHDAADPTLGLARNSSGGLSELGLLVSIVLFVASAALGGAVFLYREYAETSSASKLQQLQRAKDAFEPSLIQELTRLDDRMHAADQVLSAHIAPIALFDALQQATLSTVSFGSFDFVALDPQRMSITTSGVAEGVNSIALQADLFSKNGVITNPIFSDISRQPDGVHFTLSAVVNPAAINYVRMLTGGAGAAQQSVQQPAAQGPSSPFGGGGQTQTQPQSQTTQIPAGQQTPQEGGTSDTQQ